MRPVFCIVALLAVSAGASAHDFWLQPSTFTPAAARPSRPDLGGHDSDYHQDRRHPEAEAQQEDQAEREPTGRLGEDDEKRAEAEVQKLTDEAVHELDGLLKQKEAEILEV